MCAIVDASVKGEVFGRGRAGNPAAMKFIDAIAEGTLARLVIGGGKLRRELRGRKFERFLQQAVLQGTVTAVDDDEVDKATLELKGKCLSNDAHAIALARVSGARLLFTNDRALRTDFEDVNLVGSPPGKVYSTLEGAEYTGMHARLLRENVCMH